MKRRNETQNRGLPPRVGEAGVIASRAGIAPAKRAKLLLMQANNSRAREGDGSRPNGSHNALVWKWLISR